VGIYVVCQSLFWVVEVCALLSLVSFDKMFSFSSIALFMATNAVLGNAQDSGVSFRPCPILGPRFPLPSGLTTDGVVLASLKNMTATFDEIIASGESSHGPIASNATSFSISVFSPTDPINVSRPYFYEYHHTAPGLGEASGSDAKATAESIYRIGSLTQVFTTWLFLMKAGEAELSAPVTKFVPELSAARSSTDGTSSMVQVSWDEITLGDLAAHLGGIARDSKSVVVILYTCD
jgi:hypothetical protein